MTALLTYPDNPEHARVSPDAAKVKVMASEQTSWRFRVWSPHARGQRLHALAQHMSLQTTRAPALVAVTVTLSRLICPQRKAWT